MLIKEKGLSGYCECGCGMIINYSYRNKQYNKFINGHNRKGKKFSKEHKIKMSKGLKKYFENPEAREKLSKAHKGKKLSEEHKIKMSKAHKKRFKNPGARENHSEALKKYYNENPEARKKISESLKKYYNEDQEAREKNSKGVKKYYENSIRNNS